MLQLRNLRSLVETGASTNTTVVFLVALMSTIEELGAFLAREKAASSPAAACPSLRDAAPGHGACRGAGVAGEAGKAPLET